MRILSILGLGTTPGNPRTNPFFYYPAPLHGDVLQPVWDKPAQDLCQVGNFIFHLLPQSRYKSSSVFKLATFWFFLREGLRLSKKEKFDCILTYGWTLTGIAGWLLARLTGSKLIVTLQGAPENAYRFNAYHDHWGTPDQDFATRLAKRVSDRLLYMVVGGADCARLLYPDQLKAYPKLAKVPTFVTHNFVPLADIPETGVRDGTLLFIGAPWYIKGVDILIEAFRRIEGDFPQARLRIIGHFPDRDFKDLIGDSRQIEVIKAMPHPEAMRFMANCSIFVLASRTEGMARVLLEAMAAGKPVIAPPVGGIAHYIQDGVTGLLFQPENVADLAKKMRILLSSPELQAQLGQKGREVARTRYDEYAFGRGMLDLVEHTLHAGHAGTCKDDTHRPPLHQKTTSA